MNARAALRGQGLRVRDLGDAEAREARFARTEEAPRGVEFLYCLNRLSVATSRARCAAIIVASPRLLIPECRTPRQRQLANALCRFREMAG